MHIETAGRPRRAARGGSSQKRKGSSSPRQIVLVGAVLTVLCLYLVIYPPSLLRTLEYVAYDEMVGFLGGTIPSPQVAIVDVDENSLAKLGQWPWPRYRIAALVEQAAALGARSIALDFLFPEPDRLSLGNLDRLYQSERGISLNLGDISGSALDNDQLFAEMIPGRRVVLGGDLVFDGADQGLPESCGKPFNVILRAAPGMTGVPTVPQADGMVCPIPELAAAADWVAAVNTLPDQDGKIRRAPLVMRSGEQWIPSLVMGAILAASGENQVIMKWSEAGVTELQIGRTVIPTDYQGNLLLPFRTRPTDRFQHISAADLLEGRVEPGMLRDKIVFIGSSASGLNDMHATPNMRLCPGIDLHALAADTILRGDFFVEPGWTAGMQFVIVLLAGVLVICLMAWLPILAGACITGGAAALLTVGFWFLLDQRGLYCSPLPGLVMLLGGYALLTLVRLRSEEKHILDQTRNLSIAQDCALLGLVSIAETRDPETGRHIIRTQHFVRILAEYLGRLPKFRARLQEEDVEGIYKSAPLHDAGKVGVPDNILLKPGKLTDEEYEIMKLHTVRGYEILKRAEDMAGLSHDMSFLKYAKEVARSHHEKWDGTGYPDKLKGEDIPISARMMALADVYDALRSKRVYKPQMPHEKAREIICEGRGAHFDPDVVDAFLKTEDSFQDILDRYADTEEIPGRD